MGPSLSTARWLAPVSFAVDFAAQTYGMLSSPNMKDVHDANLSFFSPQPMFIAGFFMPQQLFQLAWLWKLSKGTNASTIDKDVATMVDFSPFYALGNFCIACKSIVPERHTWNALLMGRCAVKRGWSSGTSPT